MSVYWRPVLLNHAAALRAAMELIQEERVHAVIGGGSSSISMIAQLALSLAGVPQVAYSSTSELLSDKVNYPTFSRTVPPDTYQGAALADVVRSLGWRRIAVVNTDDSYARQMALSFLAALTPRSSDPSAVNVRTVASLEYVLRTDYEGVDLSSVAASLYASRARVVVLLAGSAEAAAALLVESRRYASGSLATAVANSSSVPNGTVWVGVDGWLGGITQIVTSLSHDTTRAAELVAAADGAFGTQPGVSRQGATYEAFARAYQSTPPVDNPMLHCDAACRNELMWAGASAFDATRLIAAAFATTHAPSNLTNGALLAAIRTTTIASVMAGNLSLDPTTGDPSVAAAGYDLVQLTVPVSQSGVGAVMELQLTPAGHVHGRPGGRWELSGESALRFAGLPAGDVPHDGSQPSVDWIQWEGQRNSWRELSAGQLELRFSGGDTRQLVVGMHNAFDEGVAATDEVCDLLAARIVTADGAHTLTRATAFAVHAVDANVAGAFYALPACSALLQPPISGGQYRLEVGINASTPSGLETPFEVGSAKLRVSFDPMGDTISEQLRNPVTLGVIALTLLSALLILVIACRARLHVKASRLGCVVLAIGAYDFWTDALFALSCRHDLAIGRRPPNELRQLWTYYIISVCSLVIMVLYMWTVALICLRRAWMHEVSLTAARLSGRRDLAAAPPVANAAPPSDTFRADLDFGVFRQHTGLYATLIALSAVNGNILRLLPWRRRLYDGLPTRRVLLAVNAPLLLEDVPQLCVQLHFVFYMPRSEFQSALAMLSISFSMLSMVWRILRKSLYGCVGTLAKLEGTTQITSIVSLKLASLKSDRIRSGAKRAKTVGDLCARGTPPDGAPPPSRPSVCEERPTEPLNPGSKAKATVHFAPSLRCDSESVDHIEAKEVV